MVGETVENRAAVENVRTVRYTNKTILERFEKLRRLFGAGFFRLRRRGVPAAAIGSTLFMFTRGAGTPPLFLVSNKETHNAKNEHISCQLF